MPPKRREISVRIAFSASVEYRADAPARRIRTWAFSTQAALPDPKPSSAQPRISSSSCSTRSTNAASS